MRRISPLAAIATWCKSHPAAALISSLTSIGEWCRDHPAATFTSFVVGLTSLSVSILSTYGEMPWQPSSSGESNRDIARSWESCPSDKSADVAISDCTRVIQSNRKSAKDLSAAFVYRGAAYDKQKQHDKAMQDFNQAISLDADNAKAFRYRGVIYDETGLPDRAI